MNEQLRRAAAELGEWLTDAGVKLATAESCTGGLVSMTMWSATNSATYFSSGFVTYTNDAKMRLLKVDQRTLEKYIAVSQPIAREMAAGAKAQSGESVSLSVTGYAGPEDGPDGTPAGTIWFGWGLPNGAIKAEMKHFTGGSETVINQATLFTLTRLKELLQENSWASKNGLRHESETRLNDGEELYLEEGDLFLIQDCTATWVSDIADGRLL